MRKSLSILLCALSLPAFGFTPVNLLADKNNAFSKLPVYDQGPVGNCYSYAAASLVDHYRMSSGEKIDSFDKLTSTLWISTAYKKSDLLSNLSKGTGIGYDDDAPLDSGSESGALASLRYRGICTRGDMNKALKKIYPSVTSSDLTVDGLAGILENLNSEWKKLFGRALKKLRSNERLNDSDDKYSFPKNNPGLSSRPEYPKPAKPKPATNTATNTVKNESPKLPPLTFKYEPPQVAVDNTRVYRPQPIYPLPPQKVEKPKTQTPVSFNTYKAPPVSIDNTYVKKPSVDMYYFDMALKFANRTIEAGINRAYRLLPAFVTALLSDLKDDNGYWDMANSLYKNCATMKKPAPNYQLKRRMPLSTADLIKNGSIILANGRPFAIGYCSQTLKDGKSYNYLTSSNCGRHASVVVGIKDPNDPKFLIQNSWGSGCSGYHASLECVAGQGAIWVPAKTLYKSLFDMTWLN